MKVDLVLRHEDFLPEHGRGKTAIVIDVLRATTSITTALANGAAAILPVVSPADAFILREKGGYLIAGERGGLKIEGFDFGNSPAEFVRDKIAGREIVFCTSNGTIAMTKASNANNMLLACFHNAPSAADYAARLGLDVIILCAGTLGEPSLEDTVCGGMLVNLINGNRSASSTDAVKTFLRYKDNLVGCMNDSHHGQRLIRIGFKADLDNAAKTGITDVVPVPDKKRGLLTIIAAPVSDGKRRRPRI